MKNLKTFAIASAMLICSSSFAGSNPIFGANKKSASYEVSKLLNGDRLILQKDMKGKVIFSLNEKREIVVHSVLCRDEQVLEFIKERLQDQKLLNEKWEVGKTYNLPLQMKVVK